MKEKIQELERQIAALPIGYISKKTINGKTRYYHQWTEMGRSTANICGMANWSRCGSK